MKKRTFAMMGLVLGLAGRAPAATLFVPSTYPTIQSAINAAVDGDVISLNTGTYNESINFLGKAITVTGGNPENDTSVANTIIDGFAGQPTVVFQSGEPREARLLGITILGGTGQLEGPFNSGGGIFCKNSSPTIYRCVIRNNFSDVGGGLFFSNSAALVERCHIRANQAFHSGGGFKIATNSTVEIRNCLITGNFTSNQGGGGIDCFSCLNPNVPLIRNNAFAGNRALNKGSAVSCSNGQAIIINNTITSHRGGTAAMFSEGAVPDVCHNITFSNSPANLSAGFPVCGSGQIALNPQLIDAGFWSDVNGTPGNLLDDLWVDGDYRLTSGSAAIDAGDSSIAWIGAAVDYAGLARFLDDRCISNSGLGAGLPIDMGAYEFANPVVGAASNFIAPVSGSWFTPGNWSTGSVPTCTTSPTIDNRTVAIGAGNAISDQILLNNGALMQINAGALLTANDLYTSQNGAATLVQQAGGELRVGLLGVSVLPPGASGVGIPAGTFDLMSGAMWATEIRAGIGWPANGLIRQSGGSAYANKLSLGGGYQFGSQSVGRYELTGGTLITEFAELGKWVNLGRGEMLVQNATWTNRGRLEIGYNDCLGIFDIRSGGTVVAEGGIFMGGSDNRGEITVDGAAATLNCPGAFFNIVTGTYPSARTNIYNGGLIDSNDVTCGGPEPFAGITGGVLESRLFLSGANSLWDCNGHFQFGGGYPVNAVWAPFPPDEVHILDLSAGGALLANSFRNLSYGHLHGHLGFLQAPVINLGEIDPGTFTPGANTVGTFTIEGSAAFTGVWNPGLPISQTPIEVAGTATIHLGGTSPGVTHDRLDINGQLLGGGKLDLQLINGYVPPVGTQFSIVTYQDFVTPFSLAQSPTFPDDRFIIVSYVPNSPGNALVGSGGTIVATVVSNSTLVGFDTPIPETLGGVPTDVVVHDFDGLNGPDLVVCMPGSTSNDPGSVTILLNQGVVAGTWQGFSIIVVPFLVGTGPIAIAAGDFDGQNGPDIAVANQTSGTISLLLRANAPGVTFNAPVTLGASAQPRAIAAADIDGDTFVDLLVSNPGAPSSTITFLRNSGFGSFTPAGLSTVGALPISIDPADVDNDRDIDIVFLSTFVPTPPPPAPPQSQAGVLLNGDGKGAFAPPQFTLVNGIADSITLADLNNDFFIDIVTNNRTADTISYALNNAGLGYSGFVGLDLQSEPDDVTTGDFDGDGTIDVAAVVPGVTGDELKPFPNLVASGQQVQFDPTQPLNSLDGDSILIATADFDGDGDDDVVTINDQTALASFTGGPPALASVLLKTGAGNTCPADVAPSPNGDGVVNVQDLLAVIGTWGACANPSNCPTDIAPTGGDDVVNVEDLLAVIGAWGPCP